MKEQDQCHVENMGKKQPFRMKLRQRRALFSNHLIEVVDDIKCPLIEG